MAFYTGQKVVYIARSFRFADDEAPLIRGRVYTVARYYIPPCDVPAIELVEVRAPETDDWLAGFDASNFHPLVERKTDISIFKKMLLPTGKRLEAA